MHQIVIRTPDQLTALYATCLTEGRTGPFTEAFWRLLRVCHQYMLPGRPCRASLWITEREPDDIYFHIEERPETAEQGSGQRLVVGSLHYHRSDNTWGIHT